MGVRDILRLERPSLSYHSWSLWPLIGSKWPTFQQKMINPFKGCMIFYVHFDFCLSHLTEKKYNPCPLLVFFTQVPLVPMVAVAASVKWNRSWLLSIFHPKCIKLPQFFYYKYRNYSIGMNNIWKKIPIISLRMWLESWKWQRQFIYS